MIDSRLTTPVFLFGTSSDYYANIPEGWLSIKSMRNGAAQYRLDSGRVMVDDDHFLILNDRQPYEVTIQSPQAVESFCIFFPAGWLAEVSEVLTRPHEKGLDPQDPGAAPEFAAVLHRRDSRITPRLDALRQGRLSGGPARAGEVEKLYDLLAAMLQVQRNVRGLMARLPVRRERTRVELYRRLEIGREYLEDNLAGPVSLEDAAQAAALSPYHFLRCFKRVYRKTPHAYLTDRRLRRARRLLRSTRLPVTEIGMAVGFKSPAAFSTLFRRRHGVSPSAFRQDTDAAV